MPPRTAATPAVTLTATALVAGCCCGLAYYYYYYHRSSAASQPRRLSKAEKRALKYEKAKQVW